MSIEKMGRLAMRHEGQMWNAYYAVPDSMEDAILLGSIQMKFVQTQEARDRFMNIMKDALTELIYELHGIRVSWPDPPTPAPQHEKAGHS